MNNREIPEQLFQVGVKWLIRNADGLYLCLIASEGGYHDIPGGRIAEWEDIVQTLEHEIWEESGISASMYTVNPRGVPILTNKYISWHPNKPRLLLLIYTCQLTWSPTIELSHEHTEYSWETARDLYEKSTILQNIPFDTLFE